MAFITELDVINDQLATLGESPLNSLTDDHPMTAGGLRILRVASYREQAKGWWFNRERVTLAPDPVSKNILVPADAISIDPLAPSDHFVLRGRRLYNPKTTSYSFTSPIVCKLVRFLEFTDLPPTAAAYISLSAVLQFQRDYDADPQKTKLLMIDLQSAYKDLNAEHTRNMQTNMFTDSASIRYKMDSLGTNLARGSIMN